uniref:Uncharacterized protein n=1 Tax=Quercus lobata TaxID=97700 RepID=A0A7N2M3J2_QUELO
MVEKGNEIEDGSVSGSGLLEIEKMIDTHKRKLGVWMRRAVSRGRDLSLVTDQLWKKFYEREFGVSKADVVVQRMREKKDWYKWVILYEAKLKEMAAAENKAIDRVKQLYKKENERRQSRQLKVCEAVKPITRKRGCDEICNIKKGNLMKKARKEFENCREVKDLAAINRIAFFIKFPFCSVQAKFLCK